MASWQMRKEYFLDASSIVMPRRVRREDTDEERKAINELVGKTGKGYKVIVDAIENYHEENSDAELTTKQEIFNAIKNSLTHSIRE
jgi:putative protein kinase ArgK-like GTPase of G3E family